MERQINSATGMNEPMSYPENPMHTGTETNILVGYSCFMSFRVMTCEASDQICTGDKLRIQSRFATHSTEQGKPQQ